MDGPIDIADLVRHGPAVVFAAGDGVAHVEIGRAWGPALTTDGRRLTVCVEAPPNSGMARTLARGTPAAATLARIASPASVQLKGPVVDVAAPTAERLAAVADHVDGFVAETARVGVGEATARALVAPDLLSVTIDVVESVVDTPGPRAGTPL